MTKAGWLALVAMFLAAALASAQALRNRQPLPPGPTEVQHLDVFPKNMAAITTLMATAHDRVTIVADYCAYGSYSSPAQYAQYRAALDEGAFKGRQIRMSIFSADKARATMLDQFGLTSTDPKVNQETFDTLKTKVDFKTYFAYHAAKLQGEIPKTPTEFLKILEDEERECIQQARAKGIVVNPNLKTDQPLFIWIRDYDQAIISIFNFGPTSREASLMTTNRTVINLLSDIASK